MKIRIEISDKPTDGAIKLVPQCPATDILPELVPGLNMRNFTGQSWYVSISEKKGKD